MSARIFQSGDRVEWTVNVGNGDKVLHGTIESIGLDKNEGLAMVRQDGYAKSRPVSYSKLRDSSKTHTASVSRGDGAA